MWALLWINLGIRAAERDDPRVLIGESLIEAIRRRWDMSPPKPS